MENQVVKQLVITAQSSMKMGQHHERVALFDEDGVAVGELAVVSTGEGVVLTGYVTVSADDLSATDTVNEAFGKLEARIAGLETSVADHESRLDALEA